MAPYRDRTTGRSAARAGRLKMDRHVLVVGARGQLGRELARSCWPDGWHVLALGREELDLRDHAAITEMVSSRPWAAVINAAAYTAVDAAETELLEAWRVNAMAPAAFAAACAEANIPLLQVSTDYVFSGDGADEWEVEDPVHPVNVYGASKLAGELAVRTSGVRHAIVRTSWVVSAHGRNFVKTMLRLALEKDTVRVVADQEGNPTIAGDLARTLMQIATRIATDAESPSGTFHFVNAGATTWADFALEIFRQSAKRGGPEARVERITSSEFPTPARRPANSKLSTSRIEQTYGIIPRPWQTAIGDVLDELIGTEK